MINNQTTCGCTCRVCKCHELIQELFGEKKNENTKLQTCCSTSSCITFNLNNLYVFKVKFAEEVDQNVQQRISSIQGVEFISVDKNDSKALNVIANTNASIVGKEVSKIMTIEEIAPQKMLVFKVINN